MVSVFTFYSDSTCSNPVGVYSFYSLNWLERTKINEKEAGDAPLKK